MNVRRLSVQIAIVAMLVVALVVFAHFSPSVASHDFPEAATIGKNVSSFQELSDRFTALANQKGALYAYDILRRADLPQGTDLHLLGHTVGDILYKQKGVAGIADCTQEFRNACSHAIVIGALNEFGGDKALAMIQGACEKAPGGSGAYTMCFHGLGHGVFAYFNYDIPKTVDYCKRFGTPEHHDREYVECVGGSVMELIDGGGHDHNQWLAARTQYLTLSDPLAPCDSSLMPDDVKDICYTYITPRLFQFDGGDLADPQPKDFVSAFNDCHMITDARLRDVCYGGIGKEFPVLAMSRDIRNVSDATDDELQKMWDLCKLSPYDEGFHSCVNAVVGSLYWGGENDPHVVVRFCDMDPTEEKNCFENLFGEAAQYPAVGYSKDQFCAIFPDAYKSACQKGGSRV